MNRSKWIYALAAIVVLTAGCDRIKPKTLSVPLDHDQASEMIDIKYWALESKKSIPAAQVWLLAGGPGDGGFETYEKTMHVLDYRLSSTGLDVFTFDHRGIGESDKIVDCSDYTTGEDCLENLDIDARDRLRHISTTAAANDLRLLIDANRKENVPVYIYAVSYGTYLAQRFASLHGDAIEGLVLQGIAAADMDLSLHHSSFNDVAKKYLDRCALDATCNEKLDGNPWQFLGQLLEKIETTNHCSALRDIDAGESQADLAADLRNELAELMYGSESRELIPVLLYRINRCNESDVAIFKKPDINPDGTCRDEDDTESTDKEPFNPMNWNIVLSELWDHDLWSSQERPTVEQINEQFRSDYVSLSPEINRMSSYDTWPKYVDDLDDEYMTFDKPLLMLQGGFDPATPLDQVSGYSNRFSAANQHFIVFEEAAHDFVGGTPMSSGGDCGLDLLVGFLEDPTRQPATQCLDDVSYNYQGSSNLVKIFFGGDPEDPKKLQLFDAWEDPIQTPDCKKK